MTHDNKLLKYREEKIGFVPEGDAFITPGFKLKAKYIIHAVGPRWQDGNHYEAEMLYNCYKRAMMDAQE